RGQSAPGIETKPANPQQASADKTQGEVVRFHCLFRIPDPLAKIKRANQSREARANVDDSTAGKIKRWKPATQRGIQQTTFTPDHVREWKVDKGRPEDHEQQHRAELHSLGKCSGD